MIAIGIGTTRAATAADIVAAIAAAQKQAGVTCDLIASLARGESDLTIAQAAHESGCPSRFLPLADLAKLPGDRSGDRVR